MWPSSSAFEKALLLMQVLCVPTKAQGKKPGPAPYLGLRREGHIWHWFCNSITCVLISLLSYCYQLELEHSVWFFQKRTYSEVDFQGHYISKISNPLKDSVFFVKCVQHTIYRIYSCLHSFNLNSSRFSTFNNLDHIQYIQ